MKLYEILKEVQNHEVFDSLFAMINDQCSEYTKANPAWLSKPLYRGYNQHAVGLFTINDIKIDRSPVDSSLAFHNLFVDIYKNLGIKARRDNSIFCSLNLKQADEYGYVYVIIPFNGFSSSYLKNVFDLYVKSLSLFYNKLISFKNTDDPIFSRKVTEYFEPEISNETFNKLPKMLSFNQLMNIRTKGMNEKKLRECIYPSKYNKSEFHNDAEILGLVDSGLSNFIKSRIVENSFNPPTSKNEILISDCKYIAIHYSDWKLFVRYLKNKGMI